MPSSAGEETDAIVFIASLLIEETDAIIFSPPKLQTHPLGAHSLYPFSSEMEVSCSHPRPLTPLVSVLLQCSPFSPIASLAPSLLGIVDHFHKHTNVFHHLSALKKKKGCLLDLFICLPLPPHSSPNIHSKSSKYVGSSHHHFLPSQPTSICLPSLAHC